MKTEDGEELLHPLKIVSGKLVKKFDAEAETEQVLNEPYPNEHSARMRDPGEFKKFRRQNDKFGDGIHAIWGQRKTDDKWELQAIRFSADRWTVPTAKQWLKDHSYSPISFEPATGSKEGGEEKMSNECKECEKSRQLLEAGVLSLEVEAMLEFKGSPRNPYGSHGSFQFKGGDAGYEKAWRLHFSKINGGALTPAASGPIRGTIRRCEMIAAVMKPPCTLPKADDIPARGGPPSPLSGDYPEAPKDYELPAWKKPSEAPEADKDKADKLSCDDLKVIKTAAVAEMKRRITDREKNKKDSTDQVARFTQQLATAEALAAYILEREGQQAGNMLVEVFQPDKEHFFYEEVLNEQGEPLGLLRIKAMTQLADEPNKNNRAYPFEILKRETETLNKKAESRKSVSLLDHPPVGIFMCIGERLWDACGRLCRTWMDGKECWGEFLVEIQDNAKGKHLYSLLKTGFIPGVSSRGTGNTRPEERGGMTVDVICDDYRMAGYDFVCNESVEGAEIKSFIKESQQREEEEDMDKEALKEAVGEAVKPFVDQIAEVKARNEAEIAEMKARNEAAITEKGKEIEALKAQLDEKGKEIEALKAQLDEKSKVTPPPETLKVEALEEAVAKNEPYRKEVIGVLAKMGVTKDNLGEKLEESRKLVTELLTSPRKGEVHGDPVTRTIEAPTDASKVSEEEAAFRKRGEKGNEK